MKMRINTRFSVAVHVLALLALSDGSSLTSETISMSVGNHPVAVRQMMSALKKAGLVRTQNGLPGGRLAKSPEEITLCEIYQAVKKPDESPLFDIHPSPSPQCPVGCGIQGALAGPFQHAQEAMEDALKRYTLTDITSYILSNYTGDTDN